MLTAIRLGLQMATVPRWSTKTILTLQGVRRGGSSLRQLQHREAWDGCNIDLEASAAM